MFELFVILMVFGFVTCLGHLSWVTVAFVLRSLFGSDSKPIAPRATTDEVTVDEVAIFRRVLARLRATEAISGAEFDTLAYHPNLNASSTPLPPAPRADVSPETPPVWATSLASEPPAIAEDDAPILATICDDDSVQSETVAPVDPLQDPLRDPLWVPTTTEPELVAEPVPSMPRSPRASWAEVITSFLAVHNIRWGELVAGLLIVVCSIGLVISLWSTLTQSHRIVPSLVFVSANAAIFAVGLYTLAKWKLRHTSRAVLLIATLLVPLSVVAGLATAKQGQDSVSLADPLTLVAILGGTGVYGFLLMKAGRALFGRGRGGSLLLAVAAPAFSIPFIPAALRMLEGDAGWVVIPSSLAVAAAMILFQRPGRVHAIAHRHLPTVSRHQWSFLGIGTFSLVVLSATLAYLGREFGSPLWITIVVSGLPALATLAMASHFAQSRSIRSNHQLIGRVVSVMAFAATFILIPIASRHFDWLAMWAVLATASWIVGSFVYRRAAWLAVGLSSLGVAMVLSSTSIIGSLDWESVTWPRRVSGGEPMLVGLVFACLAAFAMRWIRWADDQRSFALTSAGWGVYALLNAILLSIAPADWLGIVPRWCVVALLGATLVASAAARLVRQVPALATVILAALFSVSLHHAIELAPGFRLRGGDFADAIGWGWVFATAAGVMTILILVMEWITSKGEDRVWFKSLSIVNVEGIGDATRTWAVGASVLAVTAVTIACFGAPQASLPAFSIASFVAVCMLIASHRIGQAGVWGVTQVVLAVAASLAAWHWGRDRFYSFDEWELGFPVWYWAFLFSGLGCVWIVVSEWRHREWFPLQRLSTTRVEESVLSPVASSLPLAWFVPLACVLAILGSIQPFASLLLERLGPETQRWADRSYRPFVLIALSQLSVIATSLLARRVERTSSRQGMWRELFTTVLIGGLAWCLCQIAFALSMSDAHRLIFVTSCLAGVVGASAWLLRRYELLSHSVVLGGLALVFCAASSSLGIHDWLMPQLDGRLAERTSTFAVATWWMLAAIAAYGVALRHRRARFADVSALLAIAAVVICVPTFAMVGWPMWIQVAALAAFGWAITTSEVETYLDPTEDAYRPSREFTMGGVLRFGFGVGIVSALASCLEPLVSFPGAFGSLDQVTSFASLLVIVSGIAIAGLSLAGPSSRLGRANLGRFEIVASTRRLLGQPTLRFFVDAWPITLSLLAGQIAWLLPACIASLRGSQLQVEFACFTLAGALSCGRLFLASRSTTSVGVTADRWHLHLLSVIALLANEWSGDVLSGWTLTLVVLSGLVVLHRLAYSTPSQLELGANRLAAWLTLAAGPWTLVKLLPIGTSEGFTWTCFVAWIVIWLALWLVLPRRIGSRNATIESNMRPQYDFEATALTALFVVGEWLAITFAWGSANSLPRLDHFLVRISLLLVLAVILWLRSSQAKSLAIHVVIGFGAAMTVLLHIGAQTGYSDTMILLASVVSGAIASTVLALSVTAIAKLHLVASPIVDGRGEGSETEHARSLVPVTTLAASATLALVLYWMTNGEATLVIHFAIGALAVYALGFAELAERLLRRSLQVAALAVGVLAVYLWASVSPAGELYPVLCGTMRWLVASVVLLPSLVWGLPRLLGSAWLVRWRDSILSVAKVCGGIGVITLLAMLSQEAALRSSSGIDGLPKSWVVGVAFVIGGLSLASALLAILSSPSLTSTSTLLAGEGSWQGRVREISPANRRWLIIGAQVIGVLVWLHVYLCDPNFAMLGLRRYWPYTVMGLAFLSVGLVQWASRRGDKIAAETLQQTSLYLPLVPVIGLLMSGTWRGTIANVVLGTHSLTAVLVIATGYYALLSSLRHGWISRVLLILAGNSAIWSLLANQPEWSFMSHPQLWLVPPALCTLVMAQLYRKELDDRVLKSARYVATLVIYLSSTADMLLQQIGTSLWGPIVLVMLALCGIAAGVLLRIRPFLYLGTLFVLLGVTSMVWHAQRSIDQVWPWWAFGITTGMLLLAGLMSIEKNKGKLQAIATRLAAWES